MHELFKAKRIPNSIHFMFTPLCNSQCVFCPTDRKGTGRYKNTFMPKEIFEKVINELARLGHTYPWDLWFSENGESTLHPKFTELVSLAVTKLPFATLNLVTNMGKMDAALAEFVLSRFRTVHCNIDGACAESYEATKVGLNYQKNMDNIKQFLELHHSKDEWRDVQLYINCLNGKRYYNTVNQDSSIEDDTYLVVEKLWGAWPNVHVTIAGVGYWAERERLQEPKQDMCQLIPARLIHREAFVSVDGDTYSCCMDYKCEQTFGNVMEKDLVEIWNGSERMEFLRKVYQQQFADLPACRYCRPPLPNY